MDAVRNVQRELEAAKVLKANIADLAAGDEEFIRDTLEGEVDFDGIVRDLLASIGEDEAHEAGLKSYMDELAARKDRFGKRAGIKRTMLATALDIAGKPKIETDVATVSLTKVQPSAIVTEEAEIPSEFWKPQPPKLDKKALASALKDGRAVRGATLSNGGITVVIRKR
jgi:hypothetical protein